MLSSIGNSLITFDNVVIRTFMPTSRRDFMKGGTAAGAALFTAGAHAQFLNAPRHGLPGTLLERYATLDGILKQPIFRRELFKEPVIIESVELLHYKNS